MMKIIFLITFVFIAILLSAYFLVGKKITLVVVKPITVVRNLDDALKEKPTNIIAILPISESIPVIGCEDLKSDIIPKVQLTNKEVGYVTAHGDFKLIRKSSWSSLKGPIVFGC